MPVPRRQRRRPAASLLAELPQEELMGLELGNSFFDVFPNREDMAAAWESVGEELTAIWIRDRPGERPYAWWVFTHGIERPIVNPCGADYEQMQRRGARYGFLHTNILTWSGNGRNGRYWQQSTFAYLVEKGLLEPGEYERAIFQRQLQHDENCLDHIRWCVRHERGSQKMVHAMRGNPKMAWMYFYDEAKQYGIPRPQ